MMVPILSRRRSRGAAGHESFPVSVVGRTYLERGQRVLVLAQWRTGAAVPEGSVAIHGKGHSPRNVLIRRSTGELVVRPFRGLRKQ